MQNIDFGGRNSLDIGIRITQQNTRQMPSRRYTEYTVPGRNGKLLFDEGCYDNARMAYYFAAYNRTQTADQIEAKIKEWLLSEGGYMRLEDSRDPDYYRMARTESVETERVGTTGRSIRGTIVFDCLPERWLKIGDVETPIRTVQAEQQPAYTYLNNGSGFVANPLLYIGTCANDIIVQLRQSTWIGYAQYTIAAHSGVIEIDTRTRNAVFSESGQSANSVIAYLQNGPDDFELLPGVTQIAAYYTAVDDEFAHVGIKPRWWVL